MVIKLKGKRALGKRSCRWANVTMDIKNRVDVDLIHLLIKTTSDWFL